MLEGGCWREDAGGGAEERESKRVRAKGEDAGGGAEET
jgi:hypothetical protein